MRDSLIIEPQFGDLRFLAVLSYQDWGAELSVGRDNYLFYYQIFKPEHLHLLTTTVLRVEGGSLRNDSGKLQIEPCKGNFQFTVSCCGEKIGGVVTLEKFQELLLGLEEIQFQG